MFIQVLNGIAYGGLLYLLSVGLVLIFGLRQVVNFAHGALFMIGAYIGFTVAAAGFWWGGLVVSVLAMTAAGCALDATVFRSLRRQDPMTTVLVTFGLLGQGLPAVSRPGAALRRRDN
jgi:branched-chain amino acid transport system permease protein